jgi:hypothetical protein
LNQESYLSARKQTANSNRGANMTLPNFLIIGAQKAGTTWLGSNLEKHPDIFMATVPFGEVHFFDRAWNYNKGIEWYKESFSSAKNEKAIGEKTPDYLWVNGPATEGHISDMHRNIYQILPEAKLIVVLRNPVERAISSANHIIRSGRISPLYNLDSLLVGCQQYILDKYGVIDKGRYYQQIKAYLEYFDRAQMLILIFEEDIAREPVAGLRKVCHFLDIDSSFEFPFQNKRINESSYSRVGLTLKYYLPSLNRITNRIEKYIPAAKVRPSKRAVRQLYEIYAEENEKLFNFLERKIPSWMNDRKF